ncbi:Odorant-binding protein 56h [Drosophila ananassae]|uniref:Odorant-binding protein 56h n=1 Tax=Drosophila ananassae TaxID=7217 RepID=B3MH74_DROAN|nr:general odorant-binding protein 56h [Drosophila ananassae]EDV36851.1 Odorant-binding protein 56h [Drosophila ananassae]
MKAALLFAALAVLLAVGQGADFRQVMQQCMQENQVTEANLKDFMAQGMQGTPSQNLQCYTKCLMEKQGHLTNGQFNAQALINTLKDVPQFADKMDEITSGVNACKDIKGTNDCDTAFKVTMCLKEHKAMPGHH